MRGCAEHCTCVSVCPCSPSKARNSYGCLTPSLVIQLQWPGTAAINGRLVLLPLSAGWNVLDGAVVVLGYLDLFLAGSSVTALRTVRVLRPLRTITHIKGLRVSCQGTYSRSSTAGSSRATTTYGAGPALSTTGQPGAECNTVSDTVRTAAARAFLAAEPPTAGWHLRLAHQHSCRTLQLAGAASKQTVCLLAGTSSARSTCNHARQLICCWQGAAAMYPPHMAAAACCVTSAGASADAAACSPHAVGCRGPVLVCYVCIWHHRSAAVLWGIANQVSINWAGCCKEGDCATVSVPQHKMAFQMTPLIHPMWHEGALGALKL